MRRKTWPNRGKPARRGAVTVSVAVALFPPLAAVMLPAPSATPDTAPEFETTASAAFPDVQVTGCPVRVSPLASRTVATSWMDSPTATAAGFGVTLTAATSVDPGPVSVGAPPPQATAPRERRCRHAPGPARRVVGRESPKAKDIFPRL